MDTDKQTGKVTATCAMVAACDAVGMLQTVEAGNVVNTSALWPILKEQTIHPITGKVGAMGRAIVSLNDDHGWTRPQIAEWVATIEQQRSLLPEPIKEEVMK